MASLISVNHLDTSKREENQKLPNDPLKSKRLSVMTQDLLHRRRASSIDISAVRSMAFVGKPSHENAIRERPQINILWRNISVTSDKGKQILDKVSGSVSAGELTAIMGPSGAGKTTLLNVLSGFKRRNVAGEILVNGEPRDLRVFRKLSSYIMQNCHLHPFLTVEESISFAASLKISSAVSEDYKRQAVRECIEFLGLFHCKDTKACVLSGGERKRLSIALEAISNPPVMFLDEPTSGLDSSSCLQCIKLLKALAREGRTVVCTIHQPNSKILDAFDKLHVLAEGSCIYRGSVEDLIPFLSNQGIFCPQYKNPTDVLMQLAIEENETWNPKLKKAADLLENLDSNSSHSTSSSPKENREEIALQISTLSLIDSKEKRNSLERLYSGYATSYSKQFRVLLHRNILCTIREPVTTQARFLAHIIFGVIIGGLFYGKGNDASSVFNMCAFLFLSTTFYIFTASMPAVLIFPTEREILSWEHVNCWYSLKMFYLSKLIVETIVQVILPVIYASIVYWMTGQPSDLWRFGFFLLSSILLSLSAQSIALIIGIYSSVMNSAFLGAAICFPFVLFSGFFIALEKMPIYFQWVTHLSYLKYGYHSIMQGIYSFDRPTLSCEGDFCMFEEPEYFLQLIGMDGGNIYVDYAAMFGFFVFFRILTYFLLVYRINRHD